MSDFDPAFFEGTEKKFELVVERSAPSLRGLAGSFWAAVVRRADARILSSISNDHCDAYLLSESSLFVFDRRLVMITCGRTQLPDAVLGILEAVPAEQVAFFAYERKNEVFPHVQPASFFDDARKLNDQLPGRALKFGNEDDHHLYLFHSNRVFDADEDDRTVELLMYGIDPAPGRIFRPDFPGGTQEVRRKAGLEGLLPGFVTDDHLFTPSGYSLNALRDDEYWTLHVTPSPHSSYVSFETNSRLDDTGLERVAADLLEFFRPRAFDLVRFDRADRGFRVPEPYMTKSHVEQELRCGYRVRFVSFFRPQQGVLPPTELPLDRAPRTSAGRR